MGINTEYPKELDGTSFCDDDGQPLILYHGTQKAFDDFSDEYLESLGFHFGCMTQAKHFAGDGAEGRIIRARLLARNPADIRPDDCGWLQSQATVCGLFFIGLIDHAETTELLDGGEISLSCYRDIESQALRQSRNARIVSLLESKGYDGIVYSNKQEPGDGVRRDAYLVFRAEQIFKVP